MLTERLIKTAAGRWHRIVLLEGRRLTDERCNLDDSPAELDLPAAEVLRIRSTTPEGLALCGWCFPD